MLAGRRNRRLRVEAPFREPDGKGGFTVTWVPHCDEWVRVEDVQTQQARLEQVEAGAVTSLPPVRIHMLSNPTTRAITEDMRITDTATGEVWGIAMKQDLGGIGRDLVLTCIRNRTV